MRKYLIVGSLLSVIILGRFVLTWPDSNLKYVQCEVGQGDAILISQKFNQILIDGGKGSGVIDCLENNMSLWDRNIEVVVATHADYDHIGGLDEVIQKYNIGVLFWNGKQSVKEEWINLKKDLDSENILYRKVEEIDGFNLGDIKVDFLWPFKNCDLEDNDCSIVSQVGFGEIKILLTGDISLQIEEILKENYNLKSDILKISHHGSKYSSGDDFLTEVNAKIATLGVGKNCYGHPNQEVLDKLEENGSQIRRTDQDGEIVIFSDGVKIWEEK